MSQNSGVWRSIIRNYSFNGLKSYYVKGYDDTVLRVGFRRVDVVSPKLSHITVLLSVLLTSTNCF